MTDPSKELTVHMVWKGRIDNPKKLFNMYRILVEKSDFLGSLFLKVRCEHCLENWRRNREYLFVYKQFHLINIHKENEVTGAIIRLEVHEIFLKQKRQAEYEHVNCI